MGSLLWIIMALAFIVVSLCLVGLVLLQEGKGGGLTGNAMGMDAVMGARNPFRRWTAYFFIVFVLLSIGMNVYLYRTSDTRRMLNEWEDTPPPASSPNLPTEVTIPAPEGFPGTPTPIEIENAVLPPEAGVEDAIPANSVVQSTEVGGSPQHEVGDAVPAIGGVQPAVEENRKAEEEAKPAPIGIEEAKPVVQD